MSNGEANQPSIPEPESKQSFRAEIYSLSHNTITWFGLFVIAVSVCLMLTFALFALITPTHNPYVDVIGYMVLPGVFVGGLVLCPIGILIRRWRGAPARSMISVKFALAFSLVTFFLVLPILGVAGYEGYHYTESVPFCVNVCHSVMEPQGATHAFSPHARVTCAECHIGAGATPLVKSKISGLRQVIAVWRDTYSKPIPPAITELRPARETCEQCHWPQKFFGKQLKTITHYSGDEANTRYDVQILLNTGGSDQTLGRSEGIHMHMLGNIEFVATDKFLQTIPWVRYTDDDGNATVYRSDGEPASSPPPPGIERKLDCLDCHNRGAHEFRSPRQSVDYLLGSGQMDATLPYIKREAVKALARPYRDTDEARARIKESLVAFYRDNYRDQTNNGDSNSVDVAVRATQDIYARTIFPKMDVNWKSYPSNIGHLDSPGCFRCHDGKHVSDQGVRISSDCRVCHTFLYETDKQNVFAEDVFDHPMKIHELWEGLGPHRNMRCDQCHGGGPMPLCVECHASGEWLQWQGQGLFIEDKKPTSQNQ